MNSTKKLPSEVAFRDRSPQDDNFILSSWVQSARHSPFWGAMPKEMYFKKYRPMATTILNRSYAFVACHSSDPDLVFGYVVYRFIADIPVISYVYIKQAFRSFGLATHLIGLVSPETKIITNITPKNEAWLERLGCVFDPFIDLHND